MNVLTTICAREGSRGVPDKNTRNIGGDPLIVHTIRQAKSWGKASNIIISTDSDDIAEIGRAHDVSVPFMRPGELATDEAPKLPVIQHGVRKMEELSDISYDYVIDLDPTAPLRTVDDIEACFQKIQEEDVKNVYTVCEADKNPYFNMVELDEDGYAHLSKQLSDSVVRRQDAPTVYEMNASIYAYQRDFLMETESVHSEQTKIVIMPPERSVDIDRPIDLKLVELLMEEQHHHDS